MDMLNIDFNSLLEYAISAFTEVYGKEYYPTIYEKTNKAIIIQYNDVIGLSSYINYLKHCKSREYSIKFLDKIGIDIDKYKKENYTEHLDDEIEKVLESYIGNSYEAFNYDPDYSAPIRAFNKNNKADEENLLQNKIKIINYLLDDNHEPITEENLTSFTKTDEYLELLKKISEFNVIYNDLLSEYNEWKSQLLPYEKYIENEIKRKEDILLKMKNEIFKDLYPKLPLSVREIISNKTLEKQLKTILGYTDISMETIIESFSNSDMEKLTSSNTESLEKYFIIISQSKYLNNLGITVPSMNTKKCKSKEEIKNYLNFINQDNIKKYIPSDEVINYIKSSREKKYEEALKEYYTTRTDFINIITELNPTPNDCEFIYNLIKQKRVCILSHGVTINKNEFASLMFYTIRNYDEGLLFQIFMHEIGHIIDQSPKGCGFESKDNLKESGEKNPYDNSLRKYEIFNEALNDIFTIEAVKSLQNKGIYLIQSKEFTKLDTSNQNTPLIIKNLLYPLVEKYRKQVIRAKINADSEELIKYIGKDNFEQLVDVVNKVIYLIRNGVVNKIDKEPKDSMVIEYLEQIERVKQIYINIDNYYVNKLDNYEINTLEITNKTR